jgi:hypothetical protein
MVLQVLGLRREIEVAAHHRAKTKIGDVGSECTIRR